MSITNVCREMGSYFMGLKKKRDLHGSQAEVNAISSLFAFKLCKWEGAWALPVTCTLSQQ